MIEKGEEWGSPATSPPDHEITGDDRVLAAYVTHSPGRRVRFRPTPDSDLARAVGLDAGSDDASASGTELAMDALVLDDGTVAVNMAILGTAPDRLTRRSRQHEVEISVDGNLWFAGAATTVVVAVGQWLRGLDLIPRGHPGDGRVEVQAYQLRASERAEMRRRLAAGTHLPHPRILTRTARSVDILATVPMPLEVDGENRAPVTQLVARVKANAYRLLV
jgi:YegS C-terminal NAD kinase beta sandwich-like domain